MCSSKSYIDNGQYLLNQFLWWTKIKLTATELSLIVGNPNRKKMHVFGFVGIFEYIC